MVYKWELDHLWDSIATSNMDGNMPSHVDFAPLSDWSIPQEEGSKSSKSKLPLWAKKRFKVDFPTLLQVNLHVKGKQFGVVTPGPYPGSCSHEFWGICWTLHSTPCAPSIRHTVPPIEGLLMDAAWKPQERSVPKTINDQGSMAIKNTRKSWRGNGKPR